METNLEGIAVKARKETNLRFTSLCHHITRELVWESLCHIPTNSAPGVDDVTVKQAKENFPNWIEEMLQSVTSKRIQSALSTTSLDTQTREEDRQAPVGSALYNGSSPPEECIKSVVSNI